MILQRFFRNLGVGLLAVAIATSVAVVPPWALKHLWTEVDRASQLGILDFYGLLIVAVIVYACLASHSEPGKSSQKSRLF